MHCRHCSLALSHWCQITTVCIFFFCIKMLFEEFYGKRKSLGHAEVFTSHTYVKGWNDSPQVGISFCGSDNCHTCCISNIGLVNMISRSLCYSSLVTLPFFVTVSRKIMSFGTSYKIRALFNHDQILKTWMPSIYPTCNIAFICAHAPW